MQGELPGAMSSSAAERAYRAAGSASVIIEQGTWIDVSEWPAFPQRDTTTDPMGR